MRTFAQKPTAIQANRSAKFAISSRGTIGQSHELRSILSLQRTIGNQAMQRMLRSDVKELQSDLTTPTSLRVERDFFRTLIHAPGERTIQTKLAVDVPGDSYEQQADRVAEQVMRMPEPRLPRACSCGEGCPDCSTEQPGREHENLRTKRGPTRGILQRKGRAADLLSEVGSHAAPTSGSWDGTGALPLSTRTFFEQRLGSDFSSVRVHADSAAADQANALCARAFTRGDDVFFGAGEYAPATARGRELLAHELVHVVQQRTGAARGIQCAPRDCAGKKRSDVDAEVRAQVAAAEAGPSRLTELYLTLKRARACFSAFDEAAFLALVPASTSIYATALRKKVVKGHSKEVANDDRKLAWAESLKPFAGYLISGFDTANRFVSSRNLRKLGATPAPSHEPSREFSSDPDKAQRAFSEANVLVFSGHQYAQYKLPGVWTNGGRQQLDVRGVRGPLTNVKLLISTSCATLCKEAYEVWKPIFPNAIFLGAARSTPLKGSTLANSFVKGLPQDLLFDSGATGLSGAIGAWKSAVERTQTGNVRGGVLDIAAGTVEFWDGGRWVTLGATDADNICHVKGDYSATVPDPRASP